MPELSLRWGDITLIPVVPLRLEFAELVRRAIRQIDSRDDDDARKVGPGDCIAVALPQSVRTVFLEGIDRLPRVSLALSPRDDGLREVFPITPADAIVEAVRIAQERDCTLEFVDSEVAPATQAARACVQLPDWPEDGAVFQIGMQRYLDIVRPFAIAPPLRVEPVDTWRELHMVQRIRSLLPRFRRIILVCDVAHAANLERLWRAPPVPPLREQVASETTRNYELASPSLPVLRDYLDDYPKLVELYDNARWRGTEFVRRDALLSVLYDVLRSKQGRGSSTRAMQAFELLMINLLAGTRRWVPAPQDFLAVARVCFGEGATAELARRLLTYGDQLQVTHARFVRPVGAEIRVTGQVAESGDSPVVRRSCGRSPSTWERFERNWPRPPREGKDHYYTWPDELRVFAGIRRKALAVAQQAEPTSSSIRFSGSLWDGLDYRRTLRASLSGKRQLFVRKRSRSAPLRIAAHSPVVWISEAAPRPRSQAGKLQCYANQLRSTYVACLRILSATDTRYEEDGLKLFRFVMPAMTMFCDDAYGDNAINAILDALGDDKKRIPNHDGWKHEGNGCEEPTFGELISAGWTFVDALVVCAAKYAATDLVCVVPDGFVLSSSITQHPLAQGKRFHLVPHWKFSHDERRHAAEQVVLRLREEGLDGSTLLSRYGTLVNEFFGPWL